MMFDEMAGLIDKLNAWRNGQSPNLPETFPTSQDAVYPRYPF